MNEKEVKSHMVKLESRNVCKKSNICIMVYMLFNLLLIWGVLSFFKFSWQGMKTSRDNEYEADRFSSNCGYNRELIDAFETLAADSESPKGIFATLSSSHPDFDDRIAMLQSYQKKEAIS